MGLTKEELAEGRAKMRKYFADRGIDMDTPEPFDRRPGESYLQAMLRQYPIK